MATSFGIKDLSLHAYCKGFVTSRIVFSLPLVSGLLVHLIVPLPQPPSLHCSQTTQKTDGMVAQ